MPILRLKEQLQQPKCIEERLKIIAQMLQTVSELGLDWIFYALCRLARKYLISPLMKSRAADYNNRYDQVDDDTNSNRIEKKVLQLVLWTFVYKSTHRFTIIYISGI
jgi:hypothetical protein